MREYGVRRGVLFSVMLPSWDAMRLFSGRGFAVRRRRRTRTSHRRVAVRREGTSENCTTLRVASVVMGKFSGRGMRRTQLCECRCGPPRGRGRGPHDSNESQSFISKFFICYLLCGQKVTPKTAAVKRFRGRPCACAESDACGTFEAIKRFPILYAPSPRPPFSRNRFCRGMG